jgi:hypothetical protein
LPGKNPHFLLLRALPLKNGEKGLVTWRGRDTPDAIRQRGAIFRFSLIDNFDSSLSFPNI